MKLKRYIIPFLIFLPLSLSACSAEQGEEEVSVSITETDTGEGQDAETEDGQEEAEWTEEQEDDGQSGRSATDAYVEALYAILTDHVWPDGEEIDDEYLDNLTGNQFAIHDVDDDGVDELILSITESSMAGMMETVYQYNAETDTISEEITEFPGMDYYDNGVILAGWSHNQGKGMKLWPFTLYVYDAGTDSYTCVGSADSWDEDFVSDGFPSEYDADGDGTIYYLYEANSLGDPQIADGAEYHEWLEPYLEGASLLEFQWYQLDDQGIADAAG